MLARFAQGEGGSGKAGIVSRLALVLLSLAAAGLAVGNGLDRLSRTQPGLARHVPGLFSANAAQQDARSALAGRQPDSALAVAEAAVRAAPLDPDSTALLGAARILRGDAEGAERAFLVAGQLGWRSPLTQFYWMQRALEVNDVRVAALRLDAILRADPAAVANRALLAPLEADAAGRAALADRLGAYPNWLVNYTADIGALGSEDAAIRADVINRLAAAGHRLGCEGAGPLTRRLVALNSIALARAVWSAQCPERAQGIIADAAFANFQVHQPDSPFDWTVIGDSDVSLSVEVVPGSAQRRLLLASSASFPRKALTQLVMLPPGNYRLSWTATDAAGAASDRIAATVSCVADSRDWLPAVRDGANNRFVADFAADATCPARWLGFSILPGTEPVHFGGLALAPR